MYKPSLADLITQNTRHPIRDANFRMTFVVSDSTDFCRDGTTILALDAEGW
jgi:hypothetical protein